MLSKLGKYFNRGFLLGALLFLSLLSLVYGWPALYGGISLGISGGLRDKLYAREPMSEAELDDFITRRHQLLAFWDSWLGYDDLAQAVLAKAETLGLHTKAGRDLMPEVMRLEKEALVRNPANSFAWARLAYARMVYNGPSRLVTMPLLQSIHSGPYEPSLLPSRIAMMLNTKPYWPEEMAAIFQQQVDRAWISQSLETTRAVFFGGQADALRAYLESDPVKLVKFDKWVSDLRAEAEGK